MKSVWRQSSFKFLPFEDLSQNISSSKGIQDLIFKYLLWVSYSVLYFNWPVSNWSHFIHKRCLKPVQLPRFKEHTSWILNLGMLSSARSFLTSKSYPAPLTCFIFWLTGILSRLQGLVAQLSCFVSGTFARRFRRGLRRCRNRACTAFRVRHRVWISQRRAWRCHWRHVYLRVTAQREKRWRIVRRNSITVHHRWRIEVRRRANSLICLIKAVHVGHACFKVINWTLAQATMREAPACREQYSFALVIIQRYN